MSTAAPLLRMSGITKSFFGVQVLNGIDLEVRAGEVHALVGENGAGKSTLMKILAGVQPADNGTIELDGKQVSFASPLAAQGAGVTTVFQEFNLLPERTVAENVYLGREPRKRGLVDKAQMVRDTDELLHDLGVDAISAQVKVRALSVAEQQVVEIVKAMSFDARIISMDEPTAALADHEVELLYRLIRRLQDRGVAVLYVSHRLKEIFDLCDRITILKDGSLVDTVETAQITSDELVRKMVGRSISALFPEPREGTTTGDVRLSVRGAGNHMVRNISFDVRAGEIVALAGLQGSGRTEIAHGLFGVDRFSTGEVHLDGKPVDTRSPRHAVRSGLALVTEDRKVEGLALNQSVAANARLVLDAVSPRRAKEGTRRIPEILSSLELAARSGSHEVRFLSGGNQQKVVLAKWLVTDPGVIIMDEPTRGIDVGAKRAVYELMRDLAAAGVAIVLISSELPEVIGMADRILVLHDGEISGELPGGTDEESVMALATRYDALEDSA